MTSLGISRTGSKDVTYRQSLSREGMVEYCDSLEDRPGRLYSTVSLVSGPAKRSEHVFKIKK